MLNYWQHILQPHVNDHEPTPYVSSKSDEAFLKKNLCELKMDGELQRLTSGSLVVKTE